jgi:hypothetical protein
MSRNICLERQFLADLAVKESKYLYHVVCQPAWESPIIYAEVEWSVNNSNKITYVLGLVSRLTGVFVFFSACLTLFSLVHERVMDGFVSLSSWWDLPWSTGLVDEPKPVSGLGEVNTSGIDTTHCGMLKSQSCEAQAVVRCIPMKVNGFFIMGS